MRLLLLSSLVFFAVSLGCTSGGASGGGAAPRDPWVPIAQYLGNDDATGDRITKALKDRGIDSVSAGSLGYTVNVRARDEAAARKVIGELIAREGLNASLVEP